MPEAVAKSDFRQVAEHVLAPLGVLPAPRPTEEGGADVDPLARGGVPVFSLNQDASRYFDLHHTPDDTLDKVDRAQLEQNVAAWASFVWLAADSDVDFRSAAPQRSGS